MDNKHDKLDDFLRDQLNDSSENPSWNVPGDHVFENAINALPKKEDNNRRRWLLIPLLFFIVFIGRELMHKSQIDTLENKISSLEKNISSKSPIVSNNTPFVDNSISALSNLTEADEEPSNLKDKLSVSNLSTQEINNADLHNNRSASSAKPGVIEKEETRVVNQNSGIGEVTGLQNKSVYDVSSSIGSQTETATGSSSIPIISIGSANTDALVMSSAPQNNMIGNTIQSYSTPFLLPLPIAFLTMEASSPEIPLTLPFLPATKSGNQIAPMRYGVLVGGNQSWFTMKNIPENTGTKLYAYDNSHPGAGAYAFIEIPLSKKLTIQTGIGYQYYQNQSVLEDNFLFTDENVLLMPDGKEFYSAPIDVINPLGDHSTMLAFRVSDQMHENDILSEYTTMKQELHTVHLDVSLSYKVLSINKLDLSIGAGLGVGYLAGLKNDFNVSCFHNGELQSSWTEAPKTLNDTQKWYGMAIGKMNIKYHLTNRLSLLLEAQYRGGISSLRRGNELNGSQTYLHAFGVSAGFSHSF